MTEPHQAEAIREIVSEFDPQRANRYFIFGSSVRKQKFHDIDLGVLGNKSSRKKLSELRDRLYDSTIPYKVDVVDFDESGDDFREHVLKNEPIVWIR